MRIAMFVGKFPVLSETFVLNQITGLIDRGHEVDIFAYNQSEFDSTHFHEDVLRYGLPERTHHFSQLTSSRWINLLRFLKIWFALLLNDPAYAFKFFNVFQYGKGRSVMQTVYDSKPFLWKKPYDIIHCQFGNNGLKALTLRDMSALKNAKLVTCFRGFDITYLIKLKGKDYYEELFKKGDFFITNSDFFRERTVRLGCDESRLEVLRSGINHHRYPFGRHAPGPHGEIRLVSVGRFVEKKGLEYGIRAAAKLAQDNKRISYDIIGYGPLEEELKQLVKDLGAEESIRMCGQKNTKEVIGILQQSQIFLAPSVTGEAGDQDGPVNTIKEALCMGLPVIATRHGGIPELIQDGISGFLVPERDVEAIAERIQYYIAHPQIWAPMALAGRKFVEEHYDLDTLNDKLVAIYERILKFNHQDFRNENNQNRADRDIAHSECGRKT